jgi:hypothetical protein
LALARIVDPVEGMHAAISQRWFKSVGSAGKPVRVTHNAIAAVVYASVRLGTDTVGLALNSAGTGQPATRVRLAGIANGLWGDTLGRYEDELGIEMSIRSQDGRRLTPTPERTISLPGATDHVVVLVHGLFDNDGCWRGSDDGGGLLQAVAAHPALTPVTVSYNSGLAVAANGKKLSALLEELVADWPVPVRSIAFLGHSLGGLVIRHACATGISLHHDWAHKTSSVITLGSPHLGSHLESAAATAARALAVAAETRPLARFIAGRSQGIKDLLPGTPHPELPPRIAHHFVAGVVTREPAHPIGRLVGDWIVRPNSATGGRRLRPSTASVLGGLGHSALRNDPASVSLVLELLAPTDAGKS